MKRPYTAPHQRSTSVIYVNVKKEGLKRRAEKTEQVKIILFYYDEPNAPFLYF